MVVEDEMLLAMDLQMILEEEGCEVVGPASTSERALQLLAEQRPHAVTLDMNLDGRSSAPVAAALREMSVPFVVVSGYSDRTAEDPLLCDAPLVKKPYDKAELCRKLGDILK